ncbi:MULTISPECIES: flagellar hook protein FlgE [Cupriavidus]|uniref:Flagellar hook protein FlgE n=1 Tax=Cupriavidus pinatubonensis (strain JMP 134 / LMG 1197) TaxID=264198 RepID=Q46PG1_CUPPJ|nr:MULTISPECIES: flagellar hook protein FlgE [Cupriavidus]QYY29627.1 flagellar hook protein FlgE [Cupriavidus pinatubonensis]TPQ36964.1 flagellar hook protein FlgE [Cupriavidus pinatubonensis]
MGFGQGVSGINAAAANLDVIGNNIANSNTVGYKASTAQFADVYAGTKIGLGTTVNSVVQSFTQGNIQATNRSLDVAITNGSGFFRLVGTDGSVHFSRNGQFARTDDGRIVNAQGLQLTGFPPAGSGGGALPQPLVVSSAQMPPKPTGNIKVGYNLDSRSSVPATAFSSTAADPTATPPTPAALPTSDMYSYSNSMTVYDSLGNSQQLVAYFGKSSSGPTVTGGTDWTMNVTDAAGNVMGGSPITLAFDSNGKLTSTSPATITLTKTMTNGASDLSMKLDLAGTTQFGSDNDVMSPSQDGYASGALLGFAIEGDGTVRASYSNEQTQVLGQVVLASFGNPEGLKPEGGNTWAATGASGEAIVGAPGGARGQLLSSAVEASNVDLSGELVNLIVAQRNYQANAKTIETQNQVMNSLMNM